MSEQDTSPDPQNNSASGTSSSSGAPNIQANSNPVTESEKPNNPTTETSNKEKEKTEEKKTKEKRNRFNEWLYKYSTEDNPILDSNELNKKYPFETLASIFWVQEKDRKIILWALPLLLLGHTIFYYLKLPQSIEIVRIVIVDLLRIVITATFLIFAIKNAYSAYQNRVIIVESFKKHPLQFFTTIIAVGGLFALTIPAVMNVLKLIGDSSTLTTALLSITGGFIAVFGLIKSHQKSELEREQLEVQKQKDARDHIRQLHGSYNDRFDKAVAELNNDDVRVAYAAVPKLAKLTDAWLDYEDLSNDTEELEKLKKKAKKEAQTIINILCKYIRTLPDNYTHEQLKEFDSLPESDKKTIANEADIRRLIFSEISDRSSKVAIENGKISTAPGEWSDFEFDFSRAPIFYPLDGLRLENSNFTESIIYKGGEFTNTKFIGKAIFNGAHFKDSINFTHAHFIDEANFQEAHFEGIADFSNAHFEKDANFTIIKFHNLAIFHWTYFIGPTYFNWTDFKKGGAKFTYTRFAKSVGFNNTHFYGTANFEGAHFAEAYFVQTDFNELASFKKALFHKELELCGSNFVKLVFFNSAYFNGTIKFNAVFHCLSPFFGYGEDAAHFSCKYKFYGFEAFLHSPHTIDLGKAELDGIKCRIPVGTVLFDPESPMDHNSEYQKLSDPAKPIEESDNQGETPSK